MLGLRRGKRKWGMRSKWEEGKERRTGQTFVGSEKGKGEVGNEE